MAGRQESVASGRGPAAALLGQVALALAVFLGGLSMTAAWVALFFTGPDEPGAATAPPDPLPVRPAAPRLLWLVFDAMRADAAFDAGLMPNLARLRRRGAWGIARTGTFTMTGTCVRALGTGVQPRPTHVIHNFRSPPIRGDSLFRRVKRAGKRIVLIGDHIWVDLYRNTVSESHPQPDLGIQDVYRTDRDALRDTRRHLPRGWDLAVLHLVGSDHAAHKERGVRGLYRRKLADYDRLLPELQRLMGRDAAILVTADHACNHLGNHGAGELEAMRAPYVLSGPGVRAVGRRDIDQRAIAPTVTALLGVPAPWGAEVPGLLEALRFSAAERTALLYNHAFQRRAHLRRLLERPVPELDRLLAAARLARAEGRLTTSRRLSRQAIARATRRREAAAAASPLVWLAAASLLLVIPLLLLVAGRGAAPGPVRSVAALAACAGAVTTIFCWGSRPGALLGASLLALLAGWGLWSSERRGSLLWRALLVSGLFGLALVLGWAVDFTARVWRGDEVGRLWAVWPVLGLVAAAIAFWRRPLWRALTDEPALWVTALGALLLLPLPALRWWGGRHALFALLGLAVTVGLLLWALLKERRNHLVQVAVGVGALILLFGLGLFTRAWESRLVSPTLAWLACLVAPAFFSAMVWKSKAAGAPLCRPASLLALAGWAVAHGPRLLGGGDPSLLILVVAGLIILTIALRGGPAQLMLLLLALFRLLADDPALAAMTLFALGLLGLARGGWSLEQRLAPPLMALGMTLLELVLFDQLGRNFSFGTIDVTVGFVGGGELDLWRITVLVLASYAVPWWLLWAALPAQAGATRPGLVRVHVLLLWLLAVKLLGTFLIFLGRPAHFWMIHSLIPFQFFALCHLLLILLGFVAAWAVLWRRPGAEDRARLSG